MTMENGAMIKLELSPQMVAVIGAALGNMPFNQVAAVIAELQKQIVAQEAAAAPTPDDEDKKAA